MEIIKVVHVLDVKIEGTNVRYETLVQFGSLEERKKHNKHA